MTSTLIGLSQQRPSHTRNCGIFQSPDTGLNLGSEHATITYIGGHVPHWDSASER